MGRREVSLDGRTSARVSQFPGCVFREPCLRNEISFPQNQEVGPAPSKDAGRVESILNPHKILISWFLRLPGNQKVERHCQYVIRWAKGTDSLETRGNKGMKSNLRKPFSHLGWDAGED